jgi:hypothetical protein
MHPRGPIRYVALMLKPGKQYSKLVALVIMVVKEFFSTKRGSLLLSHAVSIFGINEQDNLLMRHLTPAVVVFGEVPLVVSMVLRQSFFLRLMR